MDGNKDNYGEIMATTTEPLDQRLRDGTTLHIIQSQKDWWRTRSEGWIRVRDMRLAHVLHTLGWLEDHAVEILSEEATRLYREAPDSLFSDDLVAEADFLMDNAATTLSSHLAVRTTLLYQHLVFRVVDRVGSGVK